MALGLARKRRDRVKFIGSLGPDDAARWIFTCCFS